MKRRAVIVVGATCLVVGILGVLVLQDVLSADPAPHATVTAAVLLALVPIGFLTMFEALVTWPDDGSPYPLRRRATSVATALATVLAAASVGLLVAVLLRQALLWVLAPDSHAFASGTATLFGLFAARSVWLRLRTRRWSVVPDTRRPDGDRAVGSDQG